MIEWANARRGGILKVAIVGQVVLLIAMIVMESLPLAIGQRIVLKVRPVDPRDYFRGDYVILSYDFNQLVPTELQSQSEPWNGLYSHEDEMVYVSLAKAADGNHWEGKTASLSRPGDGGTYLRGRIGGGFRNPLRFGIEAYFVQEGKGKVLEALRNDNTLLAEVAVAPWGQAKLVRLFEDESTTCHSNRRLQRIDCSAVGLRKDRLVGLLQSSGSGIILRDEQLGLFARFDATDWGRCGRS